MLQQVIDEVDVVVGQLKALNLFLDSSRVGQPILGLAFLPAPHRQVSLTLTMKEGASSPAALEG